MRIGGGHRRPTKPQPTQTPEAAYVTPLGRMFNCEVEALLATEWAAEHQGKVDLLFTSPPFPLRRKKKYGNRQDEEYLKWLTDLAKPLSDLLSPTGSLVMEVGNAWEEGRPIMATLALEALLAVRKGGDLKVCQQFVCHNPARLPAPAEWVNIQRIRVKDSYTHVWWYSRTDRPRADNRQVLQEYSPAMEKLLKSKKYNSGARPSEYDISETSFLVNNGGAIPPSALTFSEELDVEPSNFLQYSNTASSDLYMRFCRDHSLPIHPARMPMGLPSFFIKFLTEPGALVMDPFAGSNTTGSAAESLGRRWVACEPNFEYVQGSVGRFVNAATKARPSTKKPKAEARGSEPPVKKGGTRGLKGKAPRRKVRSS